MRVYPPTPTPIPEGFMEVVTAEAILKIWPQSVKRWKG